MVENKLEAVVLARTGHLLTLNASAPPRCPPTRGKVGFTLFFESRSVS